MTEETLTSIAFHIHLNSKETGEVVNELLICTFPSEARSDSGEIISEPIVHSILLSEVRSKAEALFGEDFHILSVVRAREVDPTRYIDLLLG